MTILVTGGAGFIGSNYILHSLEHSQESIINFDKLSYASNLLNLAKVHNDSRYCFVKGDILDKPLILELLRKNKISAIIHFAAESHVDRAIHSPEIFIQTNILGTFKLLEAARKHWDNLPHEEKLLFRFVHISTDEVYGTLEKNAPPFSETHPYAPNSPYSASKAAADHLVRAFHKTYGLPVLTINCSNNYGPRQYPEKLIPLCIHNALNGKSIPIYGDGTQVRDWIYVTDHCRAIHCILQKGKIGEQYNVGGENEQTNIAVVNKICSLLDLKVPLANGLSYMDQIVYVKDRPGHDFRYAIDATKIKLELEWRPLESFVTGIEKTVNWYLKKRQ